MARELIEEARITIEQYDENAQATIWDLLISEAQWHAHQLDEKLAARN